MNGEASGPCGKHGCEGYNCPTCDALAERAAEDIANGQYVDEDVDEQGKE